MQRRLKPANGADADVFTTTDDDDLHAVWDSSSKPGSSRVEHDEDRAASFSSAVRRNETTPSKRRHAGSDASARRARDADMEEGPQHARARTLDGDLVGPGWKGKRSTSRHPLKAPSSSSLRQDAREHDTRPTTTRRVPGGDEGAEGVWGLTEEARGREREREREMLVIVHQVQSTDSLAGVALKYGIHLAELRRANQLWTSDSIHLRNTLYIPVDKARHVRHLASAPLEDGDAHPDHSDSAETSGPGPPSAQVQPLRDTEQYTLRRVPASQLSYFPPPNPSHTPPSRPPDAPPTSQTPPSRRAPWTRPPLPPGFARAHDAPLRSVLDAFSSSLHITTERLRAYAQAQAPGALALASRLSMDSTSGTTASSASEDLDWEHEMDHITTPTGGGSKVRAASGDDGSPVRAATTLRARKGRSSSPGVEGRDSVEMDAAPFGAVVPLRRNGSTRSRGSTGTAHANGHAHRVVPYALIDDDDDGGDGRDGGADGGEWRSPGKGKGKTGEIRTAQLEPSPGMQLPALSLQRRRPQPDAGDS